jgi:Ras-related protein Rab-7A
MQLRRHKDMVKLLVLGDSSVGKTSVLNQFVNREFSSQYRPTIGCDLIARQVEIDGALITLQIWDTAGQERFRALASSFYRNAEIGVFIYDLTCRSSFASMDNWYEIFTNFCLSQSTVPLLLLGNKLDLADRSRQVATKQGREFASEKNMLFFEVSAKSAEGIVPAFEAVVRQRMAAMGSQMTPAAQPEPVLLVDAPRGKCAC